MNETLLIITGFMTFLLFLVQRSERKARRLVLILAAAIFVAIHQVMLSRGDASVAWQGLVIAIVLNGLFWFLIGRYNPPGSSDDIQVLGMDD
jgi:hypothetical protein